jgi:hypothetical protein
MRIHYSLSYPIQLEAVSPSTTPGRAMLWWPNMEDVRAYRIKCQWKQPSWSTLRKLQKFLRIAFSVRTLNDLYAKGVRAWVDRRLCPLGHTKLSTHCTGGPSQRPWVTIWRSWRPLSLIALNAMFFSSNKPNKTNTVAWVRERTIPTERLQLVGEVSVKFCG